MERNKSMTAPDYDDDDQRFARGAMNASLLSVPIWALIVCMVLWSCGAFAQNTSANAGAESNSGAVASSGAQSGSAAIINFGNGPAPNVNAASNVPNQRTIDARAREAGAIARATGFNGQAGLRRDEAAISYSGGTRTDQNVTYGGQYRQDYRATIRNTPDAYAPAITGGTNPCTQGLSGGGSVAGFGVALGGSWSDPNCERRNLSALLHNQGQPQLAQEVLCETSSVREARRRMGNPCIVDMPQRQDASGPVQQVIQPAQAPLVPQQAVNTVRSFPEWCYTATAQERRRYPPGTCG
jgi:hypothetical protein